jgi:hypothetical protein
MSRESSRLVSSVTRASDAPPTSFQPSYDFVSTPLRLDSPRGPRNSTACACTWGTSIHSDIGRLAQHTHAEAQILRERVDERDANRLPAFLFESLVAAELEARAINAGSLEIVGAVLDMGAELHVHVVLGARTMKQGGDGTNER